MKRREPLLLVLLSLLVLSLLGCTTGGPPPPRHGMLPPLPGGGPQGEPTNHVMGYSEPSSLTLSHTPLFGFMPAMHAFSEARAAMGSFDRPFFEHFQWGQIEITPGVFRWDQTDRYIKQAQAEGFQILANIQPFAGWDQELCHRDLPITRSPMGVYQRLRKGKPCEMAGYLAFVEKLVERYDGDGLDDMPGLMIPIKHWEVLNEPEFNREPMVFFQGDADDYFEILKASYRVIKTADPAALVVQGGMAGMMVESVAFWQRVFDLGGARYFDIANMHSIGHGEHLNIPSFLELLERNQISKPFWITEVQYQQSHQTQGFSNSDFAKVLARSYLFAIARGASGLFYVNIRLPRMKGGAPFDEHSALISDRGARQALFDAHHTVASILGELKPGDRAETLVEHLGGWSVDKGSYRFTLGERTLYALWGDVPIPAGLPESVEVTDIRGERRTLDRASLVLSDSPIFVEPRY